MLFSSHEAAWAFICGYESFTGTQMIRQVNLVSHCPYRNELYVEAYRNGFHTAASLHLMESLSAVSRLPRAGRMPLILKALEKFEHDYAS